MNVYERLLSAQWKDLPDGVRSAHSVPLSAQGEFVVIRGKSKLANWVADRLKLPRAGRNVKVILRVTEENGRCKWQRTFGDQQYPPTLQWTQTNLLHEKTGAATYVFLLVPRGKGLLYKQVAFRIFGLPMPRSLSMRVWAKVDPAQEGWHVRVAIRAPFVGLLCRYAGNMRPE